VAAGAVAAVMARCMEDRAPFETGAKPKPAGAEDEEPR